MLSIKVNYFITYLSLLSLVFCQLAPGNYHIFNSEFSRDVLAASRPDPGSTIDIEPVNNNRVNLEVWTINRIGGNSLFHISLHNSDLFLSVDNNEVVIIPEPFNWQIINESGEYRISPADQQLIHKSLNVETTSRNEVNLAPSSDSNTQRWIIHPEQ
jgi:hypothetical protein